MLEDKAGLYAAIIALVVIGILTMLACILCKICLNSRKAQRLTGFDAFLAKRSSANGQSDASYNKNIVSQESDFMLKMQQGDYVGYDAMERDITISKLPLSVSKEGLSYTEQEKSSADEHVGKSEDNLDMTMLKSAPQVVQKKPRAKSHGDKPNGYSFHNSYTIYEESSDFSGNESCTRSVCSHLSSNSVRDEGSRNPETSSESSLPRSESCQSLGMSLELLELHGNDSGLGQVEYSLHYHRDEGQVVLHILQAKELDIHCGANGSLPDTFIKTFASDCHDRDPKKQTKICKATVNPVFKEKFIFCVDPNELPSASITLQVFTRDHYARQKLVGEITAELSPLLVTDSYRTWSNILDYDHQPTSSCADVKVSLEYDASLEQTTVVVLELRALKFQPSPLYNLKAVFLDVTLISAEEPVIKKRTGIFSVATDCTQLSLKPQPMIFHQTNDSLLKSKLLVELCEELPDRSHQTIGYTVLGSGASDVECGHWLLLDNRSVLHPISMWHHLHHTPVQPRPRPRFSLR